MYIIFDMALSLWAGLTFWLLKLKADCPSISVVFMGSEKYPDENAFDAFIKKHGGSDNASTDCERVR